MEKINQNKDAWNKESYNAWVSRFGTPEAYAIKIKKDPGHLIRGLIDNPTDFSDMKIMNLMGSNGNKAVALAMLGANVTVVDYSEGNKRYALELAEACDVGIRYVVSDVLKIDIGEFREQFQLVFAEMGILHYFSDLMPFFKLIYDLMTHGGTAIIKDFHPISTKLISSRGSTAKVRKHKVDGDYFSEELIEHDVAYGKYIEGNQVEKVFLRRWTLGEIVTAAAESGLVITKLEELPNQSSEVFDQGIPKTFLLKATKV
jgi:SAM-dependent methyltransferase